MLNKVELMGRFTADPELKQVYDATPVVNFSLAVQRPRKKEDGTRDVDFINCSAWRGTAEFIAKYFKKGQLAVVVGSIRTKVYLDTGNEKQYRTDVLVDEIYFAGQKPDAQQGAQTPGKLYETAPAAMYGDSSLEYLADGEELPF